MFGIKDNELHLAPSEADYSHSHWFKNEGWITETDRSAMNKIVRGYVDDTGVYVYVGDDFHCNANELAIFLKFLPQLNKELKINPKLRVHAGMIVKAGSAKYEPEKDLGEMGHVLAIRGGEGSLIKE